MLRRTSKATIIRAITAAVAVGAMVSACSTPTGASGAGSAGSSGSEPSASASGSASEGQPSSAPGEASGSSGASDASASASSGSSASGTPGGHLTVALAEAPDDLDPTTAQTFVGRIVFANLCEKLYDVDKNLNIVPQLAASLPTVSDDGKTYTIKLRSGIKFNDGTPLDANAVKTTLERDKTDKKSARASELADVTAIDVVDPQTVKLTLKEAYAPLTAILADRSGMIESPAQLKKMGDKFGQHPVCVGPFSFSSRPSSDQINLVKSKYYYDKDKVKLGSVTFQAVTQPNVRAANLRSGDINVAGRLAPPDITALQGASNVVLQNVTSLGYQGLSINVSNSNGAGKPPFNVVSTPLAKSKDLRQAFALTLDRNAINKVVFNGQYAPDCTPISPDSPYHPDITCPKPDIAKAKQLVAASGVPTPIKVTLIVQAANDQAAKLGQVIQGMAKPAGFDVSVAPTEFTTALSQAQAGKFDMFQVGWSGRIDPDQNIQPFWSPDSALNYTGANYSDITNLIQQAEQTSDTATRKSLYQQLCEKFLQEDNIIYLYHEKYTLGMGKNVSGVQYFGDGLIRLKSASIS